MQSIERLADILEFKREVMNQVPVVSTLLAVLAMTVVAVLLTGSERGRLRGCLLVSLSVASLLLMFATVLDARSCRRYAPRPSRTRGRCRAFWA